MPTIRIRDMDANSEYFVSTCGHVNESEEMDVCSRKRLAWFRNVREKGFRVKVAFLDDKPAGSLCVMPIEVCPWGPLGRDLSVVPCLSVLNEAKGKGIGRSLLIEAEKEARRRGRKGIVTYGYYLDFPFMPAPFFEKIGYSAAKRKAWRAGEFCGDEAILWKVFNPSAEVPSFLEPNYQLKPIQGKVVVDLFFNDFCLTSTIEAQRVREVSAEFGDRVVINEYSADNQSVLRRHQIPRGIFINGKEIGWGYDAPRDGIREAILQALKS
jgi:predicted N-acetyltransferase YhbS